MVNRNHGVGTRRGVEGAAPKVGNGAKRWHRNYISGRLNTQGVERDELEAPLDDRRHRRDRAVARGNDASYDDAHTVLNATIDRYPTAIAYAQSIEDVSHALRWAAGQGSLLAVRGGGHNGGGLGECNGALGIDPSGWKCTEIDLAARAVRVGGGCLWRERDAATAEHCMVGPSGVSGHPSRTFGLTGDNLIEAEFVLADGRVVRASMSSELDLVWALRGSGGVGPRS